VVERCFMNLHTGGCKILRGLYNKWLETKGSLKHLHSKLIGFALYIEVSILFSSSKYLHNLQFFLKKKSFFPSSCINIMLQSGTLLLSVQLCTDIPYFFMLRSTIKAGPSGRAV
jgi:hypothetical protein